jgi:hypothetical protein
MNADATTGVRETYSPEETLERWTLRLQAICERFDCPAGADRFNFIESRLTALSATPARMGREEIAGLIMSAMFRASDDLQAARDAAAEIARRLSPIEATGAEGWRLVPVEATREMEDAGDTGLALGANAWRTWERMVDAAPTPPVPDRTAEPDGREGA